MTKTFIDLNQFSVIKEIAHTKSQTVFLIEPKNGNTSNNQTSDFSNELDETKTYYSAVIHNNIQNDKSELDNKDIVEIAQAMKFQMIRKHAALIQVYGISPIDFNSSYNLSAITNPQTQTLKQLLVQESQSISPFDSEIYMTQKLIILYGIASAMSFLHNNGIIVRTLNTSSIFIDHSLHPFIYLSRIYNDNDKSIVEDNVLKPPEVYHGDPWSYSSDVYSFAMVAYELLTGFVPFNDIEPQQIPKHVQKGLRPKCLSVMPEPYQALISDCWSQNPRERPTFEQILHALTNDAQILTDIDDTIFFEYVDYVEKYQIPTTSIDFQYIDFPLETESKPLSQYIETLKYILSNENLPLKPKHWFMDFQYLNLEQEVSRNEFTTTFKAHDRITGQDLSIITYNKEIQPEDNDILQQLNHEINIHLKLYHPSICQFIGFSPIDFDRKIKPLIITESSQRFSLVGIIKLINHSAIPEFSEIEKFIIIYGICEGMSYLHNNSIVHSNLNSHNILLTDQNYPLIKNFCNSEILKDDSQLSITRKKFDVFSFGLIAYELLNNKLISNPNIEDIQQKIASNEIPEFEYPIPSAYEQLIRNCLSLDETKRPTFSEILTYLKTDPYFTDSLESKEFLQYNQYYTQHGIKFIPKNIQFDYDDFSNYQINYNYDPTKIAEPRLEELKEIEEYFSKLSKPFIDLTKYLYVGQMYKYSQIIDKGTGVIWASRSSKYQDIKTETVLAKLNRHVNIAHKLTHPGIAKFGGFSPVSFTNQIEPVIVDEYSPNGTLKSIIKLESCGLSPDNWDSTQKLIVLYGIATAMAFLHKHGIVHRKLQPSSILINDSLYPRIGNFAFAKFYSLERKISTKARVIGGSPFYMAPEILNSLQYSEATDVYAFAITAYEIITNLPPYQITDLSIIQFLNFVAQGNRPSFVHAVPKIYKDLIEECWSTDPSKRPTFDAICKKLDNEEALLEEIDIDLSRFDAYKAFITESIINFDKSNCYLRKSDFVEFQEKYHLHLRDHAHNSIDAACEKIIKEFAEKKAAKVKAEKEKAEKEKSMRTSANTKIVTPPLVQTVSLNEIPIPDGFTNINNYVIDDRIGSGSFGDVYKVHEKSSGNIYAIKVIRVFSHNNKNFSKEFMSLNREIMLMRSIRHAAILRFIGFSPVDFDNQMRPSIITDFHKNGALSTFIGENGQNGTTAKLDDTQKLIILYGIASGMAFLHKHGYVHRDLKAENILMNDNKCPVICDFGLSKLSNHETTTASVAGLKGTLRCMAPEIFEEQKYDTPIDVFAFAILAYELLTNCYPFICKSNWYKSTNGKRPITPFTFPDKFKKCYVDLITECSNINPNSRPSFSTIVMKLQNEEFMEDIDREKYENYINSVEEYGESYNSKDKYKYEDFLEFQNNYQKKLSTNNDNDNEFKTKLRSSESAQSSESCGILQLNNIPIRDEEVTYEIAKIFLDRSDDPVYRELGNTCLETAANRDHLSACLEYAETLKKQLNYSKALKYFRKAADLEHSYSQFKTGKWLCSGKHGIPKNPEDGLCYLNLAANNKTNPSASFKAQQFLKTYETKQKDS